MSEFHVQVVRIGKVGKHPNADTLSITQVSGHYPVIFKTGAFEPGDLAIHVPPDALVPVEHKAFAWLADKATNGFHRVRFAKIRKVPSYGFLVPLSDVEGSEGLVEGQNVQQLLGVEKYDPGPCYQIGSELAGKYVSLPQEGIVPHYDIEGLRKYEKLFAAGEEVIITEKIHGSNGRWLFVNGELFCGSRTKFRQDSVWNRMAEKYRLKEILAAHEALVLYGEVYGKGIQDLTYGIEDNAVAFFDAYDTRTGLWWNWDRFAFFCEVNSLPVVPILKRGSFDLEECYRMAEGTTVLGDGCHVREGIVVKPKDERWDQEVGRVFLKLPGEGYLLRAAQK